MGELKYYDKESDEIVGMEFTAAINAAIATLTQAGIMKPDGVTVAVDDVGVLSAMGGNLLMNDEVWITESGEWKAPVTGWYDIWMIGGGYGAYAQRKGSSSGRFVSGGSSGDYKNHLVWLTKGEKVDVAVGSGGQRVVDTANDAARIGGITKFGPLSTAQVGSAQYRGFVHTSLYEGVETLPARAKGEGFGGGSPSHVVVDAVFYGGGGAAYVKENDAGVYAGNGAQGAIRLRFWNPAKAAGPAAAPAKLRAGRRAAASATVNLYDPATGLGSVWREEDAEAKLDEGLITQEVWREICEARAAEERAAWLASPETVEERFALLRAARDDRLAASDYLVTSDYPLTEEQRAAVSAYRTALRDLPAQDGAPWDGGGEETPWPVMSGVTVVKEN